MRAARIRSIAPSDARAAYALVDADSADTPYAAQSRWALDAALDPANAEARALVAMDAERDTLLGLVAFGPVAGAVGAARVLGIVVTAAARLRGVAAELCAAMAADLSSLGTRLVVAEVPEDPVTAPGRELLRRVGFREEARVPDYFRDGVPLVILRRDLAAP
jgi:ribosomal protein S18 acetylase RimI-like enzyme